MRRYPEKGGQFAIIWVDLLYEDSVPASAKLLYGEIYRLSSADGWCDASNKDFCDLLGCSENTVRNLLKALVRVGQISIHTEPRQEESGGTVRRIFCGRRLTVPEDGCPQKIEGGTPKNLEGVPPKNCCDTYTKSNKKGIPPLPPTGGKARSSRKRDKSAPEWKPERFEAFWDYYRTHARGEDRQGAVKSWDKLRPDDALIAAMGKALQVQVRSEAWRQGVGIPYAKTWLNNRRWEDAPPPDAEPEEEERRYGWQ